MDDVINGPIRDVFLKHAAHLTFCLYLQHAHHTIGAEEAVVKVEGTAHLMNGRTVKDIISFGNKVVPTTWMASDGQVLPMEFAVVPATYVAFFKHFYSHPRIYSLLTPLARIDTATPSSGFLSDLISVLTLNGCDGLFGVDSLATADWTEMKVGDASVVVPSNDSDDYDKDEFIPVAFAFDEEQPKFKVHGKCGRGWHEHTSKPK